jgi:hypothetical protein
MSQENQKVPSSRLSYYSRYSQGEGRSADEETIELPKMQELLASAAVVRCTTPIKLRGHEIKTMREIMKLTLTDFRKETR